jgi:hypothetical protein
MSFETSLNVDEQAAIAQVLISGLVLEHPLPWRVESDWTEVVRDNLGNIVAKCRDSGLANKIIQFATEYGGHLVVAEAEVLTDDAANPDTGMFAAMQEEEKLGDRLRRIADGEDPDDLSDPLNR